MITEEEIERACAWLRDHAEEAAKARAERLYLEQFRKTKKAQIMKGFLSEPVSAQEREAYASEEYIELLNGMKEAIKIDEYNRFMREAAIAKIEAWRTQEANRRGMDKLG